MASNSPMLQSVNFSSLINWSVRYLLDTAFSYKKDYQLFSIGDFLTRNRNIINVQDDVEYKQVKVKLYNKGVFLRDTEIGKNIGTKKQYLVETGNFILSKIDARNGAFGIIPDELKDAIVTNDFPTFILDETKINPQFLVLITTTDQFIKFAQSCSSGTTNRQRIDIDLFLDVKIPLPSLEEQNRIVKNYYNRFTQSQEQELKAKQLERDIDKYFLDILDIEKISVADRSGMVQIINYSQIDRWDHWVNKGSYKSKSFKNMFLGDIVIGKPVYGANVKGINKKSETRYIRITDINENGGLNKDFISPEIVEEKYLLKENDFLIARSGNTVGKTFLFKKKYGRAIYAGYLVKYNIDFTQAIPEYLLYFSKSIIFKKWIDSNQRVSGQPNINGQEYLQSPLILPPFEIQKEIAEHISNLKEQIENLKIKAEQNRASAIKEFEREIFK